MTVSEWHQEIECIVQDCEECAKDAERSGDKGLMRAWFSVAYRVRRLVTIPLGDGEAPQAKEG